MADTEAQRPKLVEFKPSDDRETTVHVWKPGFKHADYYHVTHFEIESGVLAFETDRGQKICTNLPFWLSETAKA